MTQTELNEIRETHIVPLENIIAELRAENERLRADNDQCHEQLQGKIDRANLPAGDALDRLWKEIILERIPDYGDWEYPGQAYRHLKAEFDDIKAENNRLHAELAKATQFTEYVTYEHGDLADLLNSIRSAISDGVENLALDLFGLELLIEEMESQHHEIGFLNQEQKKLNAELAKLKPSWDDAPNNHNWLSMQPDGVWYWWENEPRLSDVGEWWSAEGWFHKARVRQWNKIKEERPKVTS